MCIRDRGVGARLALVRDEVLLFQRSKAFGGYGLSRDGPGAFERQGFRIEAVSYTHLRAHETVLDLVCRLLL